MPDDAARRAAQAFATTFPEISRDEFNVVVAQAIRAGRAELLAACRFALDTEKGRDRPDGWVIETLETAIRNASK